MSCVSLDQMRCSLVDYDIQFVMETILRTSKAWISTFKTMHWNAVDRGQIRFCLGSSDFGIDMRPEGQLLGTSLRKTGQAHKTPLNISKTLYSGGPYF